MWKNKSSKDASATVPGRPVSTYQTTATHHGRPGHFCTTATLAAITARTTNGSKVPGEISPPAVTAPTPFCGALPECECSMSHSVGFRSNGWRSALIRTVQRTRRCRVGALRGCSRRTRSRAIDDLHVAHATKHRVLCREVEAPIGHPTYRADTPSRAGLWHTRGGALAVNIGTYRGVIQLNPVGFEHPD